MSPAQIKDETPLKQVLIRMPLETHRELVVAAQGQKRSVNAHLNFLIEQSLEGKRAA